MSNPPLHPADVPSPPHAGQSRRHRLLALAMLGVLLAHAVSHYLHGTFHDMMWICNVSLLLLAMAGLFRLPRLNLIATAAILGGTPLWLLDLLSTDGQPMLTSFFTHFGGILAGAYGVWTLGAPRGCWWRALLGFSLLQLLTRLFTDEAHNINLAFRIWTGWEDLFAQSYLLYNTTILATATLLVLTVQLVSRALLKRFRPSSPTDQTHT